VHSGLLSAKSESLRALITGEWAEKQSHEIDWSEWEEDTVRMFLEWLYTGTYASPEPEREPENQPEPDPEPDPEPYLELQCQDQFVPDPDPDPDLDSDLEYEVQNMGSPDPFSECVPKPDRLPSPVAPHGPRPLTPLKDLPVPAIATELSNDALWNLRRVHHGQHYNYSSLLMSHAKIYVLAQYTGITSLNANALRRLKGELCKLQDMTLHLTSPVIGNIIELVQYVYTNTDRLVSKEESFRRTVSTFCAHKFLEMQGEGFRALLEEGGDFVGDFWEKVARKVKYDIFQAGAVTLAPAPAKKPKGKRSLRFSR
jgi:hypothetical protein